MNHLDPLLSGRLILPGSVTAVVLAVAYLVRAFGLAGSSAAGVAVLLLALSGAHQVRNWWTALPYDPAVLVALSGRLSWVRDHTAPQDLIIGEDVVDVPFYFGQRPAVSFSAYPYTEHVTREQLVETCRHHLRSGASSYLILHTRLSGRNRWEYAFGSFIADLAATGVTDPRFIELARPADGVIFLMDCPG